MNNDDEVEEPRRPDPRYVSANNPEGKLKLKPDPPKTRELKPINSAPLLLMALGLVWLLIIIHLLKSL